jgi:cell division septal protein FtsQ
MNTNDFDKSFKRMQSFIFGAFIAWGIVVLLVLAGIAFVVYKLLVHFKIM